MRSGKAQYVGGLYLSGVPLYRMRNKLVERRLHIAHSPERREEEEEGGYYCY